MISPLAFLLSAALAPAADPTPAVDFNRDIRPILSENCFQCHGPDDQTRKAKLRLDRRDSALSVKDELLERIASVEEERRMPPAKSGKRLTADQVSKLKAWIAAGAPTSDHWAFRAPVRPPLPAVKDGSWVRNPVDRFILSRLEREGLRPSPEADRTTLIRRVTLDLTGLPPTPAEVDAFLADRRPNAYELLVDRLLNSVRYGERMALDWLDAARFADTHGYHIDSGRDMTLWREWVIDAFNRNLPFDQFTVEQLAGDLLPNATTSQKVASGFNRNHMINFEGGAIPEEYHTAYIIDRVNTTGTVWLGLTVGCSQCHDHKYDPISQREFYQLFAFFHNVPENGLDGSKGNAAPTLRIPNAAQQKRLAELTKAIEDVNRKLTAPLGEVDEAQARWEESAAVEKKVEWIVPELTEAKSQGGAKLTPQPDKSILVTGENPATDVYSAVVSIPQNGATALRLEVLPDRTLTAKGPGRSINGNLVLTDVRCTVAGKPWTMKAASADFSQQDFPIAQAIDKDPNTGWAIHPEVGKAHTAVFEFERPIPGDAKSVTVSLAFQSRFGQHQAGRFRLAVTPSEEPRRADLLPPPIRAALQTPKDKRSTKQLEELRNHYRTHFSAEFRQWNARLAQLKQEQEGIEKVVPTAMVMQEMSTPRDTYLLVRGQYDKKGDKVKAGVPAVLPPLPAEAPANRLGLARWLVAPGHPLTSRVIVNRYWQMYFGAGLVKTAEDFGSQGEWPSHPELLDYLATEFIATGWDVKRMQKLIATSATYRQSSKSRLDLAARDPENRMLGRMSRLRLQAEFLRDQALAVSGLLNGEIGGASVSPYQPPGLWEELASREDGKNWTAQTYTQSKGKDLYRRTMYTYWKRTSPPPTLVTFDAPDRETCTVRRARTNTPLQALVMLNDPTYVEASRKLAERLLREAVDTDARLTLAFRLATGRPPRAPELAVLRKLHADHLARYRGDSASALKLLGVGEMPRDPRFDVAELAAWTMIASTVLNLDESVTRG